MPEESFNLRKKLEEMQADINKMTHELTKITAVNELLHQDRTSNSQKLERLESDFTALKGGLGLIKGGIGFLAVSAVTFFTWIVSSNFEVRKDMQETSQRIAVNEARLQRIQDDLNQHEKELEKLHDKYK